MTRHALTRRLPAPCAILVFGALTLAACGSGSAAGSTVGTGAPTTGGAAGAVKVVAAENVWGDITRQIGGSHVSATSIISDPNTDPHQYETDARDAAAVSSAAFVIENGLGYDDFADRLLKAGPNSTRKVLSIAKAVGAGGDNPNPHLWYNPAYVVTAAHTIETRLATEDPADAATFRTNLTRFLAGEAQVAATIRQIRTRYAGAPIAYTERVPGYLVTAAGLTLATPASFSQSIEDGNDPSPVDTAAFDAALTGRKVRVLLYNGQVTSPITEQARALAKANGIPVIGVTETLPPDEKDFQTWQNDQAKAILGALGG
ncbi:zinc ABC transporter substrate-binding protein [Frankia sp. AgPm24]|uniref:metal ABC transporter solute-binding protein, Zn/Mn family n=1 Tax=Frankia sp. AgPm24 TaxID=631128 RepID=UPI00200EA013|nr:zinc ABC transporter substrate-binding protein [Frankia sp. AgPm24]MCK9921451.1 zinc ABC transporter substrate-binding protein [Frankia sp. AgPm24]